MFNTIFDPAYEKDFPLTTITMAALRASMLMRVYGYSERDWAEIAARNYRHALRNPLAHLHLEVTPEDVVDSPLLAWPIHRLEACPMSEGVRAGARRRGPGRGPERGLDPGHRVHLGQLCDGDRIRRPEGSLVHLLSLQRSAARAYADAGVTDPRKEFGVVELYSPFSSAEAMTYPALGFCAPLDGPRFIQEQQEDPSLPVFNPPAAAGGQPGQRHGHGPDRRVRAAGPRARRGTAGGRRPAGGRDRAGWATQFSTVCVLGTQPLMEGWRA